MALLVASGSVIDTNDSDDRGRCRRHPHIKLRKKKLFRKGWKFLMSACPDCCIDELRRIGALEEENHRRRRMGLKNTQQSNTSKPATVDAIN